MNASNPVTWRTHYALFVLASIYVFNYIDRQLMAILIEPVKLEFGISDTGIGLLSGVTFAVFYTVFGFPLGRLSDRIGRKPVIAFSCIAWSLMTMLCGMAGSFLTLVLARIGVAVGEAGGTAPSVAMVSDLYPARRRSTALAVLMLGSSLGAIVGLGLGGWIAQHHGWRYAFLLIGAPGIFLGLLLLLTVRAPKPALPPAHLNKAALQQEGWLKTLVELFQMPSFLWLVLTGGAAAIAGYAIGTWSPSFLIRSHGLNLQEAGFLVGVVGGTGSTIGTLTCGLLTDRMARRDVGWQIGVPLLGTLISIPFALAYFLWPQGVAFHIGSIAVPQAFLFYSAFGFFGVWWATPCLSAITHLFPASRLAQATAIFVMSMTLLGVGVGPLLIGMLSDFFIPTLGGESLRYALASSVSLLVLAAVFLALALPRYRQQLKQTALAVPPAQAVTA
ncbi:MFS transporter [Pseudomonas sp. FFUP_PS_473]|uniref:spinster family MFS transporter n=1 Tax=Pseudomonas TaxID=286 RepID=UPI00081165BD|nr:MULTISPECIES: MFS transporter [Pseudomonas]ATR83651.1 MFS transporter [Pseudomonas sp. HLS-6]MEE3635909.1 MFS transporter [Pseudomonas sp. AL 58]PLP95150.1 MFS transporter [Pseudomonas sp. FFUP_PS_473]WJM95679.1 MFS transporter [Pseudomonas defluvii]